MNPEIMYCIRYRLLILKIETMTCIIGYIDTEKEIMYMAGDSAGVSGYNVHIRKDPKVFERTVDFKKNGVFQNKEKMLFGFTTSFRMGQILMYCGLPICDRKDEYEYMVRDLVPCLIKAFGEGGFLRVYEKDEKDQKKGGTFIVAFRGRLFIIEDDFQVAEQLGDFAAVGCGARYAEPVLETIDTLKYDVGIFNHDFSIKQAIELAMDITKKNSGGVSGPIRMITAQYHKEHEE